MQSIIAFIVVVVVVMMGSVDLVKGNEAIFISAHNAARSGENLANPALPDLVWDSDLAAECVTNVAQCSMTHDNSRSGHGQNLASFFSTNTIDLDEKAQASIDSWMSEKQWYSTILNTCSPTEETETCGHYTQVVDRRSLRVGCAMNANCDQVQSKIEGVDYTFNQLYVCCNYDPAGNVAGKPPY